LRSPTARAKPAHRTSPTHSTPRAASSRPCLNRNGGNGPQGKSLIAISARTSKHVQACARSGGAACSTRVFLVNKPSSPPSPHAWRARANQPQAHTTLKIARVHKQCRPPMYTHADTLTRTQSRRHARALHYKHRHTQPEAMVIEGCRASAYVSRRVAAASIPACAVCSRPATRAQRRHLAAPFARSRTPFPLECK